MGRFRTKVVVFGVSFAVAALMLELSGYREMMGVSWVGVVGVVPGWVAGPLLLGVGVLWYVDPN